VLRAAKAASAKQPGAGKAAAVIPRGQSPRRRARAITHETPTDKKQTQMTARGAGARPDSPQHDEPAADDDDAAADWEATIASLRLPSPVRRRGGRRRFGDAGRRRPPTAAEPTV